MCRQIKGGPVGISRVFVCAFTFAFTKTLLDQRCQGLDGFVGILSRRPQHQVRALHGGKGQDRQNTLAVNPFSVFDNLDIRLKLARHGYEGVSGARMQALRINDRHLAKALLFWH